MTISLIVGKGQYDHKLINLHKMIGSLRICSATSMLCRKVTNSFLDFLQLLIPLCEPDKCHKWPDLIVFTSQRFRKQLWKVVFKDIEKLEDFRNVKKDYLKKQRNATLDYIRTGDANDGKDGQPVLQDENLIEKLNQSDNSYAWRNVLFRRFSLKLFSFDSNESGRLLRCSVH